MTEKCAIHKTRPDNLIPYRLDLNWLNMSFLMLLLCNADNLSRFTLP